MRELLSQPDYRGILNAVLEERRSQNPQYSQRALARDLGIGSGRLSAILSKKEGMSRASAESGSEGLKLTPQERRHFSDLVVLEHGRGKKEREEARERIEKSRGEVAYETLQLDRFRTISDWYHLAIVELSKMEAFVPSARWVARKLGLALDRIHEALSRLERVGLLSRASDSWRFKTADTFLPGGPSAEAVKKLHAQLLDKATHALTTQTVDEREFLSLMVAIAPERMPEIKARIERFWKELDRDFGKGPGRTKLYSLGIQFFRLCEGDA